MTLNFLKLYKSFLRYAFLGNNESVREDNAVRQKNFFKEIFEKFTHLSDISSTLKCTSTHALASASFSSSAKSGSLSRKDRETDKRASSGQGTNLLMKHNKKMTQVNFLRGRKNLTEFGTLKTPNLQNICLKQPQINFHSRPFELPDFIISKIILME